MSGKEALINIKGTQLNDCGEEDIIEITTKGKYFIKDQAFYLIYQDGDLTGMANTITSIKAQSGKVILNRMGDIEQRQVFEEGKLNESNYVTAQGTLLMGVIPSVVGVSLTDKAGSINLEYVLEIDRKKVSNNQLLITLREV